MGPTSIPILSDYVCQQNDDLQKSVTQNVGLNVTEMTRKKNTIMHSFLF